MGWRADWLERASPEAIAEYRHKERARVRKWARDNPERVKGRKRRKLHQDPLKKAAYNAQRSVLFKGYHSANELAKAEERKEQTKRKRAAAKIESYQRKLARSKIYQEKNKAKMAAYKASWYEANKDRLLRRAVERYPQTFARNRERCATDIQFALAMRLRARIHKALRACGVERSIRTAQLLGCSVAEFRSHVERQFTKGMAWENRSEWHLDHIRPIASFDLTDLEQQRVCFHFTNIRPLWRRANQQKSAQVLLLL